VLCDNKSDFVKCTELEARRLRWDADKLNGIVRDKQATRTAAWHATVASHRHGELEKMKLSFASDEYNDARKAFVHKTAATSTPTHLAYPLPPVSARQAILLEAQVQAALERQRVPTSLARGSSNSGDTAMTMNARFGVLDGSVAVSEEAIALRNFVSTHLQRPVTTAGSTDAAASTK
jgi:hypothetical protein